VRTRNLNAVQYSPDQAPTEASGLPRYIYSELLKVQGAITGVANGHLDKTYVAPTKPREGDFRYADGTSWNPNSGQGQYLYNGTSWSWYAGGKTNSATVGAVTINNTVGRCNATAGTNAVVVTNNLVTAASNVIAVAAQNDATAAVKNVVAAAGSFTINLTANATANMAINFVVFN